jgi:hypothetical protein
MPTSKKAPATKAKPVSKTSIHREIAKAMAGARAGKKSAPPEKKGDFDVAIDVLGKCKGILDDIWPW